MEVESLDGICNGRVKFDLTALLIPGQTAPLLLWEYNADLFEAATAERLMRHFLTLLAASVAQPDSAVRRLGMLSDDERRWMRQMSGGKDAPGTGERIDQVFVAIARTQPDAEAVVCGRERWTYHELDRRAEALAERLREAGVASCGVVAFERPRGPEAVAAMLAILKCGCAYLPLEPGIPAARKDALLTIVGPSAVITAGVVNALPSASGGTSTHPSPRADDAYVLFTSGSTGVPKAVFAPHRGVLRLVRHVDYVRLDASVRFLQLAPLAFDASTLEIWGPLLNGGTVVILPEEVPALTELGRVLAEERVTTAWLTASLFNRIIDSAPEILRPLRQVLTGGEALSVPHVVRALAELPDTAVINGYGPTETTTFATAFAVPRPFDPASSRVPIGSPIPDTQVYVLDEQREIQPIGVAGEIFIGGGGVGRFADRTLEDAAFVINPFSTTPGARLYRSGDRGRMLSDGTFDCLGRLDRQLKIRGRRIEPGEIESVLRRHPDVREVAVLAPPDAAGERRLVAYVTPVAVRTSDAATAAATLREFAAAVLPDYLVPSHIVFVPSLPLSTTGKIDAIALEQLAIEPSAGNHDGHIAPRTPLEAVVAGVWASVLRLESSSIDDNFFDVGGHSLLALQLIHELNVALGLNLPTRLIFIEPTIAGIARAIECELAAQFGKTKQYEALVPIKPGGTRPPFFLVAGGVGGEAELVVYAGLSRYLDARQPFFGLRARGVDELIEPHENVEKMAAEYIQEIRRVQPSGPYVIGGSCVGGVVALEMAQQLQHAGQELRALVLIDSFVPRWSRFMRNEIVNFWSLRLRPELQWAKANGFFEYARIWRRRLVNPTPEEESAQRQVEVMRTYLARLTAYKPRRYDGRVILLRAANPRAEDPVTRWRSIMNGPFEVHDIPGDHFTHLREHAKATAECLDKCLRS
jgi:aspartate racemase